MAFANRPAVKAMLTPDKKKRNFIASTGVQESSYRRSEQARWIFSILAFDDARADPFCLINMD